MKKVAIRGPLLSLSGYGNHARQVARWLFEKENLEIITQILPWGMTPWLVNPDLEDGLVGKIMSRSMGHQGKFDVSFQIQLPNEWDPNLANYNVGVSAFVETDVCNPEWIQACNKMDHVVVPSQHVKSVIDSTGGIRSDLPVSVIPEAFFDDILRPPSGDLNIDIQTAFNLLIFGQITGNNPETDRKNTFYTVKWLCEVFRDDPQAGIILKTNQGTNTTIDKKLTTNMVTQLLREVRSGPFPRFYLLHGHMLPEEVNQLYKHPKINGLVSATRGEGYGLPLLEAAASGLPVLATNWSGHLDFLNKGKFIKFNYELKDINSAKIDSQIFVKGSKWAEVDEEDFKQKVIKFRKANQIPRQWAKDLSSSLLESHSFNSIKQIYDSIFRQVIE